MKKEVEREELIKLLLSQLDRKPRNNDGKVTKHCTCIIFNIFVYYMLIEDKQPKYRVY